MAMAIWLCCCCLAMLVVMGILVTFPVVTSDHHYFAFISSSYMDTYTYTPSPPIYISALFVANRPPQPNNAAGGSSYNVANNSGRLEL